LRRFTHVRTLAVYEEVAGVAILPDKDEGRDEADGAKKKRKRGTTGLLVVVGEAGVARSWRFGAKTGARGDDELECSPAATQPARAGAAMGYTTLVSAQGLLLAADAHQHLVFLDPDTLSCRRLIVGFNDEVVALKYLANASDSLAVATNSPQVIQDPSP